jgi:hypothetical protein|tara:strand:+ start:76 stop:390 length:315 start_codon:yes stop_codon:yes gene_type:complete
VDSIKRFLETIVSFVSKRAFSRKRQRAPEPTNVLITPNKVTKADMMTPISQRFSLTYGKKEAKVIVPIEYELMEMIGCSRGDVHKKAVIALWNQVVQSKTPLVM